MTFKHHSVTLENEAKHNKNHNILINKNKKINKTAP